MIDHDRLERVSKQSFRIAIGAMLCIIAFQAFNFDRGYWALLTFFLMYAVPLTGLALRKAKDRLLGTVLGIFGAFFYENLLLYYDYQFFYGFIILILPGIFYAAARDYYTVGAFFITMVVLGTITIMTVGEPNVYQVMAERLFYTVVGILILVFCEVFIFPKASRISKDIDELSQEVGHTFRDMMHHSIELLQHHQKETVEMKPVYEQFILNYARIKEMYMSQLHELRYDQSDNKAYLYFFATTDNLIPLISAHMSLALHTSGDLITESEMHALMSALKNSMHQIDEFTLNFKNADYRRLHPTKSFSIAIDAEKHTIHFNQLAYNIQKILCLLGSDYRIKDEEMV